MYYAAGLKTAVEYDGDRSLDDFSEFLASKIGIFYRRKQKMLKEVTPDTWESVVMNPNQSVLVAFTAPWCGHCNRLKPQMEMAASSFKPEDNVTYAFIDAEQYTDFCEPYEVQGYPTIKFFPHYSPGDEEKVEKEKEEEEAAAKESEKRAARKAELYELLEASQAENATNETKAAFGDKEQEELSQIEEEDRKYKELTSVVKKGINPVEKYTGDRSASALVFWMNRHAGTFRALGGDVDEFAGLERDVAEPLVRYVHAVTGTPLPKEDEEEQVKEGENNTVTEEKKEENVENTTENAAEAETNATVSEEKKEESENKTEEVEKKEERVPPPPVDEAREAVMEQLLKVPSPYVVAQYKKYMKMLEEKGLPAVEKERERLTRMLESGHFTDQKKIELTVRKNALSLFMTV